MEFNKVIIAGNIARMGELKDVNNSKVLSFTLAVNESYKDKDGEKQERVYWPQFVAWGKKAEFISNRLAVGAEILVEGKLTTRDYNDKDGRTVYVTEIVADDVKVIRWPKNEEPPQ